MDDGGEFLPSSLLAPGFTPWIHLPFRRQQIERIERRVRGCLDTGIFVTLDVFSYHCNNPYVLMYYYWVIL